MNFTALCNIQRRQSEDVFLDRYRLSVNTFFMVSNGHSEFRYIALHLAVVASAEASPEAARAAALRLARRALRPRWSKLSSLLSLVS